MEERVKQLEERVAELEKLVAAGTTTTVNIIANELTEAIKKKLKATEF